jgi:hypothetical protein
MTDDDELGELLDDHDGAPLPGLLQRDGAAWQALWGEIGGTIVEADVIDQLAVVLAPYVFVDPPERVRGVIDRADITGGIIHIAGPVVLVGNHHRQRCSWCGAVIDDQDLTMIAFQITEDNPHPTYGRWEQGGLIWQQGGETGVVIHEDGQPLPDRCCGKLDPSATV